MKRLAYIGVILLLILVTQEAWGRSRINVKANSIKRYPQEHLVVAQGNVEITYQDVKLVADKVSLYTNTKDLIAEGNVVLYQGKDFLKCDRLEFNLYSKKGVAYRARGYFHPFYYAQGEKIEKVGDKRYIVENARFTTCGKGEQCAKNPDWSFHAKRLTIDTGGYARGGPVSFWIKKIPILYAPYIKVPVYQERKTGFLVPTPGYSSSDGYFLKVPFFWAISESQDATVTVTPYTKGALRGTLEYRYILDEHSKGYFLGDFLNRQNPHRQKWSIYFKHKQIFKKDWRLLAKVDLRSDERYSRNYESNAGRRVEQYTDSYVTLTKNWQFTHFYLEFRGKKDMVEGMGETTYRAPDFKLHVTPTPFFGNLPIYLEAENSLLRYRKKDTNLDISRQAIRADFHPAVSVPIKLGDWLTVTPKGGLRETWYNKSLKDDGNLRSDSQSRLLPDGEVYLRGPQLERVFTWGKGKLKHTIIPEVKYTYIPRKDQHEIPFFDYIDYIAPESSVTYSLTNWLYLYSQQKCTRLARITLEQTYHAHFHRESSPTGRPFSDLLIDVDTDILPTIDLDTQVRYSVYGEGITGWDTQANITRGIFRLAGSYHYLKEPEERFAILEPGVTLGPVDLWGAIRYDLKNTYVREREIRVIYTGPCWSVSLDYLYIDNRGNNASNEKKISFLVTLKGIGTVGRGK